MLAIAETNDPFIMSTERLGEKIEIFEEYACGGLGIIANEIGGGSYDLDEGLLVMIMEESGSSKILEDITNLGKQ